MYLYKLTRKRRSKEQIKRDVLQAAQLLAWEGLSQTEIADRLGVRVKLVNDDVRRARKAGVLKERYDVIARPDEMLAVQLVNTWKLRHAAGCCEFFAGHGGELGLVTQGRVKEGFDDECA